MQDLTPIPVALDYAIERGYLRNNPDAELRAAKLRANLELRRRRLSLRVGQRCRTA